MVDLYMDGSRILQFGIPNQVTVVNGRDYMATTCGKCDKKLFFAEYSQENARPVRFTGEAKVWIVCQYCNADEMRFWKELSIERADVDIPSFRDLRPAPSRAPRQPFLPRYKGCRVTFGSLAVETRPEAAKIIARCIVGWTQVEVTTTSVLAAVMKADTAAAAAVYLSLRNARSKREAMFAAAEVELSGIGLDLFKAIMACKSPLEKERDALAHGHFGVCNKIPNGLVWTETISSIRYGAMVNVHGLSDSLRDEHYKDFFVYELGTLETIARDIEELDTSMGFLASYIGAPDDDTRERLFRLLTRRPRVQKELDRVRQKSAGRERS